MYTVGKTSAALATKPRGGVIALLIFASLMLTYIPILNLIVGPITTFVTAIHEMSHAFVCVLTGGHVAGMTIVSDGLGHGGLTFCQGGNDFLVTSAGYIGTTIIGCALIMLGSVPKLSKGILFTIGAVIGLASITFMFSSVTHGIIFQGLGSMFWGGLFSGLLIWASHKLNVYYANLLVLFLGVQTGLNALNDVGILVQSSMSGSSTLSDATNMAAITGIPAPFWAAIWSLIAIGMLGATMWYVYKPSNKGNLSNF